jgi:hypothetical protein
MNGMLGWTGSAWEKISSDGSGNLFFTLDPPNSIINGQKDVAAAGTAEALGGPTAIVSVTIKALGDNTGNIYVGDSSVDSSNGFILEPGDSVSLDIDDLSDVYIDAQVNGEGVSYLGVAS